MTKYESLSVNELRNKFHELIANNLIRDGILAYFAAPWFSDKAREFYNNIQGICDDIGSSKYIDFIFPRDLNGDPKFCFQADIEGIKDADIVLAWVDEKDIGTAFEIGYAHAIGKTVVLLVYDEDTIFNKGHKTNLMLAKACDGYITLEEFIPFVKGEIHKYHEVPDNWEAIE